MNRTIIGLVMMCVCVEKRKVHKETEKEMIELIK